MRCTRPENRCNTGKTLYTVTIRFCVALFLVGFAPAGLTTGHRIGVSSSAEPAVVLSIAGFVWRGQLGERGREKEVGEESKQSSD